MARKHGSTTETAYAIKSRIVALQSEGHGRNEIARLVGVSGAYVTKILRDFSHTTVSPDTILNWCRAYKHTHRHIGANYIIYECQKHFEGLYGKDANLPYPSPAKLEQLFQLEKLSNQKLGGRSDKRAYHNLPLPEHHGDKYECDMHGPIIIDGKAYQIYGLIDTISRIAWAELLPANFVSFLPWALTRGYRALGGPARELQSDNGIGFVRPGRKTISEHSQQAFNLGTEYVHFIPEGQPQRNGHIERWFRTLEERFLARTDFATTTIEEARTRLLEWLTEYNQARPMKVLKWTAPSTHGTFNPLASETPKEITVSADRSGILAYTRHIDPRGIATIASPLEFYIMGKNLCGTYITICIHWETKEASILHRREAIGTLSYDGSHKTHRPTLQATTIEGREYDETAYLRQQSKHRKKKITHYPGDYGLRTNEHGDEELYIKSTGKAFLTSESLNADHLTDLGIIVE